MACLMSVLLRVWPGAIHLLNGLYDAKMDHMPVVYARRFRGFFLRKRMDRSDEYCEELTLGALSCSQH